jgi:uncharacterized integral membrane protein
MSWLIRLFLAILALLAFFLAALAVNQQEISLHFLSWQTPAISVFWWLLGAFASGLLLGLLGITVVSTRQRFKNRGLAKRLSQAESELQRVRNMTLHE